MAYSWAKVYIEILDDHKMGLLPDSLWRRVIELILMAKKNDKDGWLPGLLEMSWTLRISAESIEADLVEISKYGIVQQRPEGWYLTNFVKRQDAENSTERSIEFRKRKSSQRFGNEHETSRCTDLRLDKTTDTDTESSGADAPPKKKPDRSGLRFDCTPQGALMAQKLRAVYESKGHRPPEFYANAMQRDAFLSAFSALGGTVENVLDSAMQRDITERGRLLSWLQGCAKKNGRMSGQSSDLTVAQQAILISQQHDKERADGKRS